jgi:hypothetical protein
MCQIRLKAASCKATASLVVARRFAVNAGGGRECEFGLRGAADEQDVKQLHEDQVMKPPLMMRSAIWKADDTLFPTLKCQLLLSRLDAENRLLLNTVSV